MIETLALHAYLTAISPKDAMRYRYVHRQQYDTSCGLSSASSILDLYWGVPMTEEQIVSRLLDVSQENPININDIMQLLSEHGVAGRAFRMDYDELINAAQHFVPIVVHYSYPKGHFAVLLFASPQGVIVADPARGTQHLSPTEFERRWSGVALVTASRTRDLNHSLLARVVAEKQRSHRLLLRRTRSRIAI